MKALVLLASSLVFACAVVAQDVQKDVVFRATFDGSLNAQVAGGDPKLYSGADYKDLALAKPGLEGTDVQHAVGAGRAGDALRFTKRNTKAVFFKAQGNVPFNPTNWTGTISFWLRLDPDQDLEPGYCDPIQVTDKAYNDSCIWVDFTKDDKPRHFRLGVFGALASWNPTNLNPDQNPVFLKRLVAVKQPVFGRDRWTHVAIRHSGLGGGAGTAELFVDGKSRGAATSISEPFAWDLSRGTIRLGIEYVGWMDDVAIFRRALEPHEIASLAAGRW